MTKPEEHQPSDLHRLILSHGEIVDRPAALLKRLADEQLSLADQAL